MLPGVTRRGQEGRISPLPCTAGCCRGWGCLPLNHLGSITTGDRPLHRVGQQSLFLAAWFLLISSGSCPPPNRGSAGNFPPGRWPFSPPLSSAARRVGRLLDPPGMSRLLNSLSRSLPHSICGAKQSSLLRTEMFGLAWATQEVRLDDLTGPSGLKPL